MKIEAQSPVFEKLFLALIGVATILCTPYIVFDPINLPRLVVITIGGFVLSLMFWTREFLQKLKREKAFTLLLLLFLIDITIVLIFSGSNLWRSLYGTAGRNTGFLFYLMALIFLISSTQVSSEFFIKKLERLSIYLAGATSIYGILQHFSLDPINWQNKYGPEIGFFGNVDFQSAFLGIISLLILHSIVKENKISWNSLSRFLVLISSLIAIDLSGASQGFYIFALGAIFIFYLWLYCRYKKIFYFFTSIVLSTFLFIIFEIFSKFRFLKFEMLDSNFEVRNLFWQSGYKMTMQNPFLGVGFDGYIDWYRRSRPVSALTDQFVGVFADSAHNIFLDISASGGLPLISLYLGFQLLAFKSVFIVLKRKAQFENGFIGVAGAWFGYQGFSLVSISQIGIAIWGWIFTGLLIGYEINTRIVPNLKRSKVENRKIDTAISSNRSLYRANSFHVVVAIIFGMAISVPPYLASANFLKALKQSDVTKLIRAAEAWPDDAQRLGGTISLLSRNRYEKDAALLAARSVKKFPDSSFLWQSYSEVPGITEKEIALIKLQLIRLDPNNQRLLIK